MRKLDEQLFNRRIILADFVVKAHIRVPTNISYMVVNVEYRYKLIEQKSIIDNDERKLSLLGHACLTVDNKFPLLLTFVSGNVGQRILIVPGTVEEHECSTHDLSITSDKIPQASDTSKEGKEKQSDQILCELTKNGDEILDSKKKKMDDLPSEVSRL